MEPLILLLNIVIAIWVWVDAGKKMPAAWPWGLLALFTSVVGLLIYLGVRSVYGVADGYGARIYELETRLDRLEHRQE